MTDWGPITLTAELDSSSRWVTLTLESDIADSVTIYRIAAEGNQAVRGALDTSFDTSGIFIDYEAPQNIALRYFARLTSGLVAGTRESAVVEVVGFVDRGGDVVFGLSNPLAPVPIVVRSIGDLQRNIQQDVIQVVGRKDPVVVSDVRSDPSGSISIATLEDVDREAFLSLVNSESIIAFSPHYPQFGFPDIWYMALSSVTERRLVQLGSRPERGFEIMFQKVAPPPSYYIGPGLEQWQEVLDSGVSWNDLLVANETWLTVQVP